MESWQSIYFPMGEHFLTKEEVEFISTATKYFPLEHILIGDAGESNNCKVGRLIEDHPQSLPKQVNIELSEPILKLYRTDKAKKFFAKFLIKESPQIARRCQFNLLGTGAFVGRHLDIDSNPDYQLATVLQLGNNFEGGEFVVYPSKESSENEAQIIKPEYGSMVISNARYEHEVKRVSKGERLSFVTFISNDIGNNKRESYQ